MSEATTGGTKQKERPDAANFVSLLKVGYLVLTSAEV